MISDMFDTLEGLAVSDRTKEQLAMEQMLKQRQTERSEAQDEAMAADAMRGVLKEFGEPGDHAKTEEAKRRQKKPRKPLLKLCHCCGKKLPYDHFHRDASRKDGLTSYCKACNKKKSKLHREQMKLFNTIETTMAKKTETEAMNANKAATPNYRPVDYILANNLGYCEGCVVELVTGWRDNGGAERLLQARKCLDFLIENERLRGEGQGQDIKD